MWLKRAILAAAGLCLLGLFSTEIADTDFWWHLKSGQYIGTHHSLPAPDPFSYTSNLGAPAYAGEETTRYFNLTHEWLAQIVLYGIYVATGFAGVILFKALLLAGVCAIAGMLAAKRTNSFYWGLAAAFAAASVAVNFTSDRPALITFFFVAVFIAALELRRGLWLLPALSLIWANCHSGVFLGWVILTAYSIEAAIAWRRKQPAPGARRIWIITALSILVSGLNPNHFRMIRILGFYQQSSLTRSLLEWAPPSLWGPPYSFDLLLYGALAVLLIARQKVRLIDWLLLVPFAIASLAAFRNIMLIGFLAPVLMAGYLPWKRALAPRLAAYAVLAILGGGLAAGVLSGRFFQLRAAMWKFPSGAAEFLLRNHISEPLFNTYEYGGYLIWRLWPLQRVFIDGRALNESVYQDYRRVLSSADAKARDEILARYQVGAILMNGFEYTSGVVYPLALALADPAQTEWKLSYSDPQAMVWLREPRAGVAPFANQAVLDHLQSECSLHIEKEARFPLCARTLGQLFLGAGDLDRSQYWLDVYREHQ